MSFCWGRRRGEAQAALLGREDKVGEGLGRMKPAEEGLEGGIGGAVIGCRAKAADAGLMSGVVFDCGADGAAENGRSSVETSQLGLCRSNGLPWPPKANFGTGGGCGPWPCGEEGEASKGGDGAKIDITMLGGNSGIGVLATFCKKSSVLFLLTIPGASKPGISAVLPMTECRINASGMSNFFLKPTIALKLLRFNVGSLLLQCTVVWPPPSGAIAARCVDE